MTKFELIKGSDGYLIQGLLTDNGIPNALTLVLIMRKGEEVYPLLNTTTDVTGYYAFSVPLETLPPGDYEARFYGWGIPALEPEGSWVPFNITGTGEPGSAYILSADGTIVKYGDQGYTPSLVSLTVHFFGINSPTFSWSNGEDPLASTTDTVEISSTDLFANSDTPVVLCTVSGVDDNMQPISVTAERSLVKVLDGSAGPGTTYRGIYSETKQYFKTDTHCDLVKYGSNYYSCISTTPDPAGPFQVNIKWKLFGSQFDSVATDILLAQDATITRALVMGEEDGTNFGIIRSILATAPLSGNGFYLSNTLDGTGKFRVGSVNTGTLSAGLSWDGTSLAIKAAGFELTSNGDLWANSGGFGGTVGSPKIVLTSAGLQAGKTLIHGNDGWASPLTNTITNSDNGTMWTLTGTGAQTQSELSLEYTDTTQGPNLFVPTISNSANWSSFSSGTGTVSGVNSSGLASYFYKELVLEAGTYLMSFDVVINSIQGVFQWKLSTASNLGKGYDVGTPIVVSGTGSYSATITVPSTGTYYFGARIYSTGYPWISTVNFSATNVNFKIDGVTGEGANSYYLFSKTLDSSCVGKIYEFKGKFNGTDQLNQKHKFKLQILIDDVVMKESTYSKPDGVVASPYSISYTNTANSGTLKVKIIYTGILATTELPEIA